MWEAFCEGLLWGVSAFGASLSFLGCWVGWLWIFSQLKRLDGRKVAARKRRVVH